MFSGKFLIPFVILIASLALAQTATKTAPRKASYHCRTTLRAVLQK